MGWALRGPAVTQVVGRDVPSTPPRAQAQGAAVVQPKARWGRIMEWVRLGKPQ